MMFCDIKKLLNSITNSGIKAVVALFIAFCLWFAFEVNLNSKKSLHIDIQPRAFIKYDFLSQNDVRYHSNLHVEKEPIEKVPGVTIKENTPEQSNNLGKAVKISNDVFDFRIPEEIVWPRASNASRKVEFETRNDFWRVVPPRGKMVEIGVFDCDFCDINLKGFVSKFSKNDQPMYYAIDIGKTPKLNKRIEEWSESHKNFQFRMQKGEVAVQHFEDGSLDAIYIDACHSFDCVQKDIKMWRPKLKPGGLLSGHDFCVNKNQRKLEKYKTTVPWCGTYKTTDPWMNGGNPESPENRAKSLNRAGKEKASQHHSVDAVLKNVNLGKYSATLENRKNLDDDGTTASSWYLFL